MAMFPVFSFRISTEHMICVIKILSDVIFRGVRAFFVLEHFPICTWSVA